MRLEKEPTAAKSIAGAHCQRYLGGGQLGGRGLFYLTLFRRHHGFLPGHTREEYRDMVQDDVFDIIYEAGERVYRSRSYAAVQSGGVLIAPTACAIRMAA